MSASASALDPNEHLVVLREAATGKHKHVPMSDLGIGPPPDYRELMERLRNAAPSSDPRIDQIMADVAALKAAAPSADPRVDQLMAEVASLKASASGAPDPRVDALAQRLKSLEDAVYSLAQTVLKGA